MIQQIIDKIYDKKKTNPTNHSWNLIKFKFSKNSF